MTIILISLGLFALIVGVAYWFAGQEQKIMKVPEQDIDEETRQARREEAVARNQHIS